MSIFLTYVAIFVGLIFCLFVYWRRLREDYPDPDIFASGLSLITGMLVGSFSFAFIGQRLGSTRIFDPSGLWFWGGVIGIVFGIFFVNKRIGSLRLWEAFEAFIEGLLVGGIMILAIRAAIMRQNGANLVALGFVIIFTLLFFLLRRNYKRFRWYRSGKVGLSGLLCSAVFFLLRSSAAIFFTSPMLFFGKDFGASLFIGRVDGIVSSVFAFGFLVAVYNLSQNLD